VDEALTLAEVRRRSVRGWLALAVRGGAGKAVTLAGLVVLSRLLAPEDFGAFAVLQVPVGLLALLADSGLHAALVQRPALAPEDEAAGFTLRLLLAAGLGAAAALLAGPVARLYRLDDGAAWALRALALGPLVNALGTVPGMRLTRALRWGRLAWAEFGSLLAGQAAAVALALAGAGLWALVAGALATTLAGTLLVNLFAPWRPRLAVPAAGSGRALLRFGLPYQAQGLFHLAKDRAIPALGGLLLGGAPVGYLVWAQDLARWPRLPADYAARVAFPAFARLQADPAALSRAVNDALRLTLLISGALSAAGLALAPALLVPVFGAGWAPAQLPLLIFLAQTPLDALAAVLLPVIYALGQAGRGLRLSAAWAALTWLACLGALWIWPRLPAPLAAQPLAALPLAVAVATFAAAALLARALPREIRIAWRSSVAAPLLAAAALGGGLGLLRQFIFTLAHLF
jgi:O-antigen/teichoic acid export membrane protein